MDLKKMGQAVSEALALQGKVVSLGDEVSKREADITTNEEEIARLKTLEIVTEKAKVELKAKKDELEGLNASLSGHLESLKKEGIVLPLGGKSGAKQVSL